MSRWENRTVIGLTGHVAVGKGVVRQMLQHLGAYVIDLDKLAQQAISPGAPAYQPVLDAFGKDIVTDDGRIRRSELAKIIAADPSTLERLDAITQPVIDQAVNTMINHARESVIVIEANNLLESPLIEALDNLWGVSARPEVQLQRLIEQRGLSDDDAKRRIIAGGDPKALLSRADTVIDNNGSLDDTWKQVQEAWVKLGMTLAEPQEAAPEVAEVTESEPIIPDTTLTTAKKAPKPEPVKPAKPVLSEKAAEIQAWLVETLITPIIKIND